MKIINSDCNCKYSKKLYLYYYSIVILHYFKISNEMLIAILPNNDASKEFSSRGRNWVNISRLKKCYLRRESTTFFYVIYPSKSRVMKYSTTGWIWICVPRGGCNFFICIYIYVYASHTFPSNLSSLVFCLISLTKETVTHLPASSVSGRFVRNWKESPHNKVNALCANKFYLKGFITGPLHKYWYAPLTWMMLCNCVYGK